jgi:hypothetical protein
MPELTPRWGKAEIRDETWSRGISSVIREDVLIWEAEQGLTAEISPRSRDEIVRARLSAEQTALG